MNAYDPNGDLLLYEVMQSPSKGQVGLPVPASNNDIPGGYTYVPLANASGVDAFTYRACDPYGACSEVRSIFITITSGVVSGELNIEVTPSAGNVNDLVVVSPAELAVIAPDANFTFPIGAYFFTVDNLPSSGVSVVTIQLPVATSIPESATVRKLSNTGSWQTLNTIPSPGVSSGVIDVANKQIVLTLIDNDIFDLNPTLGIINDPVALAFETPVVIDTDSDGVADSEDAYPNDDSRAVQCQAGSYGAFSCVEADEGYYVPMAGAVAQIACARGSYADVSGLVQCKAADIGHYVDEQVADKQEICDEGSYSNTQAAQACTLASPGYYVKEKGQSGQQACAAGTYSAIEGATFCTPASVGSYVGNVAAVVSVSCPAGTTTLFDASTSPDDCVADNDGVIDADSDGVADSDDAYPNDDSRAVQCQAGSYGRFSCVEADVGNYVPTAAAVEQILCSAGHYASVTGATSCTAASIGTYVSSVGAVVSVSCPAGTTTLTTASTSAGDCVAESNNAVGNDSPPVVTRPSGSGGGALGLWLIAALLGQVFVRRKLKVVR